MKKPENTTYAPDSIDVYNIVHEMGDAFGLRVQFTTEFTPDYIQVIGRAFKPNGTGNEVIQYQALAKRPLHKPQDIAQIFFTVVWDLFQQADNGVMALASAKLPLGWDGRPHVRARSRKQ